MQSNQLLITDYDPLVSDSACHLRAPLIVGLFRARRTRVLTPEEEQYLEKAKYLSDTREVKTDNFGLISYQGSSNPFMRACTLIPGNSVVKKEAYLYNEREKFAYKTMELLALTCNGMRIEILPKDLKYVLPRGKIPVYPLYASAKMMLYYAACESLPLAVTVKRLRLQGQEYRLDGAVSLTYAYESKHDAFTPCALEEDQEVIAIDMLSCAVENTEAEINGFLASTTFQGFLELFQKEDIAALVMLCAVGHSQYPELACPLTPSEEKTGQPKALPIPFASQEEVKEGAESPITTLSELKVDLKACTQKEYLQLEGLARRFGFFRPGAIYLRKDLANNTVTRPSSSLALSIDHVCASTVAIRQAQVQALNARVAELSEPFAIPIAPPLLPPPAVRRVQPTPPVPPKEASTRKIETRGAKR